MAAEAVAERDVEGLTARGRNGRTVEHTSCALAGEPIEHYVETGSLDAASACIASAAAAAAETGVGEWAAEADRTDSLQQILKVKSHCDVPG